MFGQYEYFDPGMWETWTPPIDLLEIDIGLGEEWASEVGYPGEYLGDGTTGVSFLNAIKDILGIVAKPITSVLIAQQAQEAAMKAATAAQPATTVIQPSIQAAAPAITETLSEIISNPPLLIAIGIGGYLLLRK